MKRDEVLNKFFSDNPELENESNHHRQIVDWQFDTRFRSQVDAGAMDFESALNAAKDAAYKILPKPAQPTDPHEALRELAILRNQEPPRTNSSTSKSTFLPRSAEPDDLSEAHEAIRELAESRNQAPPQASRTKPHANFY